MSFKIDLKFKIGNLKFKRFTRKRILTFLSTLLVLVIGSFTFLRLTSPASAAWFDDSWAYRTKITIGNTGAADSNKKVKFDIDTATLITAGKLLSGCHDIRFTNANGALLRYFLDTANGACNTNSTDLWVLVDTINSGNTDLYMYYGNPGASTGTEAAQFGEATFSPTSGPTLASEEKGVSPQLYLKFDEAYGTSTNDSSPNNNDGSISGAAWKTKELCLSENCLYYDGTDDVVTVTNADSIDLDRHLAGAFTIMAWIRPNGAGEGTGGQIFYKGTNTWLRVDTLSSGKLDIQASLDLTTPATLNVSAVVDDSKWNHVALSYTDDGDDEITIWVNGRSVGSSTDGVGAPASDSNNILIGGTTTNNFKGFIDEFKIYKQERSSAQIITNAQKSPTNEGSSASFGPDTSFLSNGLVGYWKMDENENTGTSSGDSSGNGNDLTLEGGPVWTPGKFGSSLDFNGDAQCATDDVTSGAGATSDVTVSAWVYRDSTSTADYIVELNGTDETEAENMNYRLFINSSAILRLEWEYSTGVNELISSTTALTNTSGTWVHVAASRSVSTNEIIFYENGQKLGSTVSYTNDPTGGTTDQRLYIGSDGPTCNSSTDTFDGKIDDVRIYNRALSPAEVSSLYNWAPGPVAHWKIDENTGITVNDHSGNGNQITFPTPAAASGYVKSVEFVEVTLSTSTSETTDSTNLSLGQDITNSVPFVTSIVDLEGNTGAVDDFSQILADVYFQSGPDRVTVDRAFGDSGTGTIIYGIYVVEFDPDFINVQQGVLTFTGASDTDTITAVDQTKAAMLFYYKLGSPADNDGYDGMAVAGWFSADNTLSWQRGLADGTVTGHYYVFEAQNSEFAVQADTFSITSGNTSNTASLSPSVDMSKSFVIGSYRVDQTGDTPSTGNVSIYLASTSTVGAARSATTDNITDIRTFVVTFSGDESVQRGTFSYALDDGQEIYSSLTAVDLDYAIAWNPNTRQGQMLNNGTGSAHTHEAFQHLELTGTTTIQGDRHADSASTSSGNWEVIQFATPTAGAEPQPAWIPGKYGSALDFDGTDDYLSPGTPAALNTKFTSVMAWVNLDNPLDDTSHEIYNRQNSSNAGAVALRKRNTGNLYAFQIRLDGTESTARIITSDTAAGPGWHHVAGTYDGTTIKMYVDGVLQTGISAISGAIDIDTLNSIDLARHPQPTNYLGGKMDDVRIYDYARSTSQIIEDMNAGHPAPGSPIGSAVGHWKLDEGYGTAANDQTTNDNDLTLSTASWTNSGKFGKAWNGTGALWLSRADDADFDFSATEDLTASLWFKSDSASNPGAVEYLLNKANATTAGYAVYANTSGQICFGIDDDTTWNPDIASCTTADYYDAAWHHVTAIRDTIQDKTYIYIDAVSKDSDSDTTTATLANSLSLYLGDRDGTDNGDEFNGDLDEVKIFRSALTADQVKLLYNQSSSTVMGATSTDSSGNASWSSERSYCPPGDTTGSCAPVAEWKMDENTGTASTSDTSGNDNNLTINGSMTESNWIPGKFGSALDFDGTDDNLSRADDADFDYTTSSSFTLNAWFKHPLQSSGQDIILSKQETTGADGGYELLMEADGDITCGVDTDNSSFPLDSVTSTAATYDDNNWHFVSCVKDGTTALYLYIDGVLVGTDSSLTGTGTYANDDVFYLGRDGDSGAAGGGITHQATVTGSTGDPTPTPTPGASMSVTSGTVTSAADNFYIAAIGGGNAPSITVDSVTGLGLTWTQIDNQCVDNNGFMVAIWKGSGTPTGDGTVTANLSTGGTMEAAVILVSRYSGVNLSDPIGNYSSANENGVDGACSESIPDTDSPSVTINTTSGNLVYSAVQMRNRTITWTGLTSRGYVTTGPVGSVAGVDAADLTADASSETAAGTLSAAQDWSIIAVEIKQASGTDNWWAGQLDNVSIYNYARSSAQIAWDYNRGKPVGWWKFDECAGATANDSSGNGNNGTIYPVSVGNTAVGTCSSGTSTEMWNDGTTGKRNASLGFDGSDDYV
ncbi:MAG: hypothetical protein UY22_C0054G0004, partial [Candidatus Amesbacteria bacterium GW2011_GWC1_48_10]